VLIRRPSWGEVLSDFLIKAPGVDRCSGLNPRRIRAKEPCSTPGLAAGPIITRSQILFKVHRGKVIHSLAALRSGRPLRSAVNNFGQGIRATPWVRMRFVLAPGQRPGSSPDESRLQRWERSFGMNRI